MRKCLKCQREREKEREGLRSPSRSLVQATQRAAFAERALQDRDRQIALLRSELERAANTNALVQVWKCKQEATHGGFKILTILYPPNYRHRSRCAQRYNVPTRQREGAVHR
jgi:hypothetical protein